MKNILFAIFLCLLLVESSVSFAQLQTPRTKTTETENLKAAIVPGVGYSTDSQQIAPNVCYNAPVQSISGSQSNLSLSSSTSFSDLEQILNMSISVDGGVGMFSVGANANFMRSIQNTTYSLSLSFYEMGSVIVSTPIAGLGMDALNDIGKTFYGDGTNKFFNLMCGDEYISDYQKGVLLVMSLNLKFASEYEKKQFVQEAGVSFSNILTALEKVEQFVSSEKLNLVINIETRQVGGDPGKLSQIFNNDGNGSYYIMSCDLQHIDSCKSAASGLLDYASQNFPTQFSLPNNENLEPLGVGFTTRIPITHIQLGPVPSLVDGQVKQDRKKLAEAYKANQYYTAKFHDYIYGYPVNLDSLFLQHIEQLENQVDTNINVILKPYDRESGALGCYTRPELCGDITNNILNSLKPITADDLSDQAKMSSVLRFDNWPYETQDFEGVELYPQGATGEDYISKLFGTCPTCAKSYYLRGDFSLSESNLAAAYRFVNFNTLLYSGTLGKVSENNYEGCVYPTGHPCENYHISVHPNLFEVSLYTSSN